MAVGGRGCVYIHTAPPPYCHSVASTVVGLSLFYTVTCISHSFYTYICRMFAASYTVTCMFLHGNVYILFLIAVCLPHIM